MHRLGTAMSAFLVLSLTLAAGSAVPYSPKSDPFTRDTLKGIQTVTVNIDPPAQYLYGELRSRGVSVERLHDGISSRLREAGFNVISFTEALDDPEAALLHLRIQLVRASRGGYSYGLNLSASRKVPIGPDTSFHSVKVWEDARVGGMRQTYLSDIGDYSYSLVDNFIYAHQLQN